MKIKKLHPNVIMPTKGTEYAGAFDIYMPERGMITGVTTKFPLGFSTEIPQNHVALMLPRSSAGAKHGIELANTCGVIDSDYRGEWVAALLTKTGLPYTFDIGDRLLQFLIVPIASIELEIVDELEQTERESGGFGSTGK